MPRPCRGRSRSAAARPSGRTTRAPSASAMRRVSSVGVGVDHDQLVDQRDSAPSARAVPGARSAPMVARLVERRQDRADGHALLLLERDEPVEVARTRSGGSSTRRTSGRRAPARCGRALRRDRRLRASRPGEARCSKVARLIGVARLDHDDRWARVLRDGLGQVAEERACRRSTPWPARPLSRPSRPAAPSRPRGGSPGDVRALDQQRSRRLAGTAAHERRQGTLDLGTDDGARRPAARRA